MPAPNPLQHAQWKGIPLVCVIITGHCGTLNLEGGRDLVAAMGWLATGKQTRQAYSDIESLVLNS